MNAASLGHHYLSVTSSNNNSEQFGNGGLRGRRRRQLDGSQADQATARGITTIAAADPLSHRSNSAPNEPTPSLAIVRRCLSDSENASVIHTDEHISETKPQETHDKHKAHTLNSVLNKRHGSAEEDDKLDSRVRRFYKKQDDLIDSLEKFHNGEWDDSQSDGLSLKKQKRNIDRLIRITLVLNCTLLIAKIVAAVFSRSLSIISSVVDSAVDSASACLLFWALRAIKHRNPYMYPGGRTRLEPIIIVILSVVMVSASVQVIFESVQVLIDDVNHFTKNSTELHQLTMGPVPITVMCVTIVSKAILASLCFQIHNPTMRAVAHDHLNDVFSNIVALVCGSIAAAALSGSIHRPEVVVVDSVGAILVSFYIIFCWGKQLREQVRNLTGYKAEPEFLQKITWITLHHSPFILQIDTVRAFHFGTSFLVEVEIILPETMSLKEAHDIGDSLKEKLEKVPEVELAFVHLDYTVDALQY